MVSALSNFAEYEKKRGMRLANTTNFSWARLSKSVEKWISLQNSTQVLHASQCIVIKNSNDAPPFYILQVKNYFN